MVFCIERVSLSIEDEIPSFVLFCSKDSKVLLVDMLRLWYYSHSRVFAFSASSSQLHPSLLLLFLFILQERSWSLTLVLQRQHKKKKKEFCNHDRQYYPLSFVMDHSIPFSHPSFQCMDVLLLFPVSMTLSRQWIKEKPLERVSVVIHKKLRCKKIRSQRRKEETKEDIKQRSWGKISKAKEEDASLFIYHACLKEFEPQENHVERETRKRKLMVPKVKWGLTWNESTQRHQRRKETKAKGYKNVADDDDGVIVIND